MVTELGLLLLRRRRQFGGWCCQVEEHGGSSPSARTGMAGELEHRGSSSSNAVHSPGSMGWCESEQGRDYSRPKRHRKHSINI